MASNKLNRWKIAWVLLSLIYLAVCIGFAAFVTSASVPVPDPKVVIVLTLLCWTTPVAIVYVLGRGIAWIAHALRRMRARSGIYVPRVR